MFDIAVYKNNLETKIFGQKIIVLGSVGSTNDAILDFKEYNGFALVANKQTSGRGRMGRLWYSDSSDNLYFSFIINNIEISDITSTALFVSFSLYDILKKFGPFKIKWPNDIVIANKKVAGI
jgi:BirA family biotin operon repressor/biotin-[acetyl-CoA-carboxylase] ligase